MQAGTLRPSADRDDHARPDGDVNQDDIDVILHHYGLQATSTLRAKLRWDAENRLTGWEPLAFVPGARKVQFGYDFQGRRVQPQRGCAIWRCRQRGGTRGRRGALQPFQG